MKPRLIEYHHAILSHPPPHHKLRWNSSCSRPSAAKTGTIPPQLPTVFLGRGFFGYPEPQVGPLPQKGPIYYVNAESPDHAEKCENKTAGRQLVDFRKSRLWLTPCGLNVVDRPFSWRSTTAPQIGTPSPRELPTSCSPSALSARHSENSTTVRTREQRYTLLYLTILCYILLYFAISCYILSKGGSHANKPF